MMIQSFFNCYRCQIKTLSLLWLGNKVAIIDSFHNSHGVDTFKTACYNYLPNRWCDMECVCGTIWTLVVSCMHVLKRK